MRSTDFRSMARSSDLKLGTCVLEFTSPGIGQILKEAGCDFVFFDMEHSGFSFETLKAVLKFMQAADLPTLVRPPSQLYPHISMACDVGADGLLLPHVKSADEARAILASMKFTPEGHRGVALGIAHDGYRSGLGTEAMARANATVAFYATIEDVEGVEEADAIAAIDGVDGLIVGHNDLSASLGMHGEYDREEFRAAVDRVQRACAKHGKSYGRAPSSVAEAVELFDSGADLLIYSGDVWLLKSALAGPISELRERCQRERVPVSADGGGLERARHAAESQGV
jgi:2-keto-3-deoxy-L-rhamnonate aldolase RhmA